MPRHKYCLFPGCRGFGESVFRLPKKEPMRSKWIEAINNSDIDYEDKEVPDYRFVVCSLHFKKEDYQRDLKSELLGPSPRNRIKLQPHAVPDPNWTDPRDTDGGDATVTDHLREQAEKSKKRITVLKRKQLVNQAILEQETRELMNNFDGLGKASSSPVKIPLTAKKVFVYKCKSKRPQDDDANDEDEGDGGEDRKDDLAATIKSRVDRLLAENEAMVGVPLRSLRPNLTYEEKADILEKGKASKQMRHHPGLVRGDFTEEEQELFWEPDDNYDVVVNRLKQQQMAGPASKKRRTVDHTYGSGRDKPADPAALARAQEILKNTVPLTSSQSERARFSNATAIRSAPAVVRAARVKKEDDDDDDEISLTQPTPMNVLVKTNTGMVPKNLCLKELHQVSRGTQTPIGLMRGPDQKSEKALRGELARARARVEALTFQNKELRAVRDKFNSKRKTIVKEELMKNTGITEEQLHMMVNNTTRIKHWSTESLVLPLIQLHLSVAAYTFNLRTSVLPLPSQSTLKNFARECRTDPSKLRDALRGLERNHDFDPADLPAMRMKFLEAVRGPSQLPLNLPDDLADLLADGEGAADLGVNDDQDYQGQEGLGQEGLGQEEFEDTYEPTAGTSMDIKTEVVETTINDATVDHVTQRELQEAVHHISAGAGPSTVVRQVNSVKIVKTAGGKKKKAVAPPADNKPKQMFVYKLSR